MDDKLIVELFTHIDKKLEAIKTNCERRVEHCTVVHDQKLSSSMFRWVIGILVVALLGIGGVSTSTRIKIAEQELVLLNLKETVKTTSDKIHKLHEGRNESNNSSNPDNWGNN